MIVSRLFLKNWRNFQSVAVPLGERVFLAGPNVSGNSNFLDVFRFVKRDCQTGWRITKGSERSGRILKNSVSCSAEAPNIELEIQISNRVDQPPS